jgi:hypothetical protein
MHAINASMNLPNPLDPYGHTTFVEVNLLRERSLNYVDMMFLPREIFFHSLHNLPLQ